MNINWYPGHMKKTRESIEKSLTLVDIVFELIDARIPISSRNPIIDNILGNKPRIVILNKSDLASEEGNKLWEEYFFKKGLKVVCIDALSGNGIDRLIRLSNQLYEEKKQNYEKRGVISRPIRAMILGIPNVGKSTLINTLAKKKSAKTGNKPGITKSNQWIKTKSNLELLDTPGILWPKFEDKQVGLNLAFTGAIKDEILDRETLALKLIETLAKNFPNLLKSRYNVEIIDKTYLEIMEEIGRKRGALVKGGEIDYSKVSNIVLDEFRKGVIGRITLEYPEE
ncbi:MAG: ribosome biogenesis GTPase YlqF [Tissierellia bacterium]|nr:ribosome biogenesis GTPase YlqF [Tissierellia bacterium]